MEDSNAKRDEAIRAWGLRGEFNLSSKRDVFSFVELNSAGDGYSKDWLWSDGKYVRAFRFNASGFVPRIGHPCPTRSAVVSGTEEYLESGKVKDKVRAFVQSVFLRWRREV
jgi:hypothetical protein